MSEVQTPTFQTVVEGSIRSQLAALRHNLPAKVLSYDVSQRKATVQPLLLEGFIDDTGERQTEEIPPISNVPVLFPGSGKTRIRWPIAVGDTVLLLFSSASLDRWLVRGGSLDPVDDRKHDVNDCVALPGFLSFADAGDADVMVEFTAGGQIYAGGSQALAKTSELQAVVQAAMTAAIPAPVGAANPVETGFISFGTALLSLLIPGTSTLKGA